MGIGAETIKPEDTLCDITLIAPMSSIINKDRDQNLIQKQKQVLEEIRNNLWGCDLILCLFKAALQSYRADRCLRPFPSIYINNENKDFTALRNICDNIPALKNILLEPKKCSGDVFKFLIWLFLEMGYPILKRITHDLVPFPSSKSNNFSSKPHFVFEVCYNDKSETIWQQRRVGKEIILAYHGSCIDNFYSILKFGLQQHFSLEKTVLFGSGIYLSNELAVSAHYSPFGQTWKNSSLGNKHSVIALCEIINDVEKVKCKDSTNKNRSIEKDSLVGEIPEKYFVVKDSDMVRVKYLLVYREKTTFSVKCYIVKHLFLFSIVIYFILIVFIGVYTNSSSLKSLKKFLQMLSLK